MGALERNYVRGDVNGKSKAPNERWHFMDKGKPNPTRAFSHRIMVPHIMGHPDDKLAYMSRSRA
jgi:hypothetical protein